MPGAQVAAAFAMFLVQILLPLNRNDGSRQPAVLFDELRQEMIARFGGLTAYMRAPALGLWSEGGQRTAADDVVIFEVMSDELERSWWAALRRRLETRFEQDQIVVRAMVVDVL